MFIRAFFESIWSFFSIPYPGIGISIVAVMFAVILIKLVIKLFYYSFGFSSGSISRMTRGNGGSIVRKENDNA